MCRPRKLTLTPGPSETELRAMAAEVDGDWNQLGRIETMTNWRNLPRGKNTPVGEPIEGMSHIRFKEMMAQGSAELRDRVLAALIMINRRNAA